MSSLPKSDVLFLYQQARISHTHLNRAVGQLFCEEAEGILNIPAKRALVNYLLNHNGQFDDLLAIIKDRILMVYSFDLIDHMYLLKVEDKIKLLATLYDGLLIAVPTTKKGETHS